MISLRQLLECGVHFGHPTRKWNPKMAPYIYTKRTGIHIIDLQQTVQFIDEVHAYIIDLVERGGVILFVGTKKQAQEAIKQEAQKCGMPYIAARWLGGFLTNWDTIKLRIERLKELRKLRDEGYFDKLTKKDARYLTDELNRLEKFLGGLTELNGPPDALFIVDVKKERNAVAEARKLKIPIIAILDTNCDPDDVDLKLPGNDDAIRSIRLFCQIVADSALEAKLGYLPPDSVFVQAVPEEEGEAANMLVSPAEGSSRAAKSAPSPSGSPAATSGPGVGIPFSGGN